MRKKCFGVTFGQNLLAINFGGSILTLLRRDAIPTFTDAVAIGYPARAHREATVYPVEIVDGVTAGESVVLRAGSFLRDGDPVRPIAAETAQNGTRGQ